MVSHLTNVLRVEKGHISGNRKLKEKRVMSNAMEIRFGARES
jgi:hypothetical protein